MLVIRDIFELEVPYSSWIFPGGEIGFKIKKGTEGLFDHRVATIEVRLRNSNDIMELLMATDVLRSMGVNKIVLEMNYVPYARQDRRCAKYEALSIKVFCDLINTQNYNLVQIFDPHSDVTPALLNNVEIISRKHHVRNIITDKIPRDNLVYVIPDNGAEKKAQEDIKQMEYVLHGNTKPSSYIEGVVKCSKQRDMATGHIEKFTIDNIETVKDKNCIVVDDILDGGMTFKLIGKALKEAGAKDLYLYVSHGIFSKPVEELLVYYKTIFTTNSFCKETEFTSAAMKEKRLVIV